MKRVKILNTKSLSLFFSDINNFTVIVDTLDPYQVTLFFNKYLVEMYKIVDHFHGLAIDMRGDGLFVAFPTLPDVSGEKACCRCVLMAVAMQKKVQELQSEWFSVIKSSGHSLQIRCGIATGQGITGVFGPNNHKCCTVIGRSVNLASRLQRICKPGDIFVNQKTFEMMKDFFIFKDIGVVKIKGLAEREPVYSVQYFFTPAVRWGC